ncbi:phenylpyruvate tautomerase MIF-related protein [Clostridium sp. C8-1-8]|uniref:phenylpyruvate tautomerase MIF-related protein n=1 Tax=Clostridium sp. C8-1-8 TaxID=2698831 RepID=UPI0013720278|nr:phenylpyruvate tautomerase MIF-related protein [Clostridium sp. C8-1-8]
MPFINSKVTLSLTQEKEEKLKSELGKLIEIITGKSEDWLMVGFEENQVLYFKGKKLEYGAFVEIKIFGGAPKEALNEFTKALCNLYTKELSIKPESIYVKYEEVNNWGWNGANF